jgi:hypothetical protein
MGDDDGREVCEVREKVDNRVNHYLVEFCGLHQSSMRERERESIQREETEKAKSTHCNKVPTKRLSKFSVYLLSALSPILHFKKKGVRFFSKYFLFFDFFSNIIELHKAPFSPPSPTCEPNTAEGATHAFPLCLCIL